MSKPISRATVVSALRMMRMAVEAKFSEQIAALHTKLADITVKAERAAVIAETRAMQGPPGECGAAGAPGRDGVDGKDGTPGTDGKDGRDGVDGKDGAAGPQGEKGDAGADGKSVTIEDVQPLLDAAISRALLDLERRNVDAIQRAVDLIPRPRDGIDGKDGRDGTDGQKGADGKDGRDGIDGQNGADGANGIDGKDGRDALDLDDLVIEHDGERTVTVGFRRGERVVVKTIRFPVQIDRGVYKIDRTYEHGDGVTYGGSYWIAQRDATAAEIPGKSTAWRLAVKRGRDGRDG